MKIKFFQPNSPFYPFRWFFIFAFVLISTLAYANLTGWRLFGSSSQQQWSAKGPGYHK